MAKLPTIKGRPSFTSPAQDIDAAVKSLRSIWKAVEKAHGVDQAKLKREIVESIGRLRNRIEAQVTKRGSARPAESLLFPLAVDEQVAALPEGYPGPIADRFPKPSLRIYDKDLTEHALQHLPHNSAFASKEQIRQCMTEKIRFNSLATRRRTANYLINRFFPGNTINTDLPRFAAATAGRPPLGEALFYLTCRSELIVALVAENVVYPSLAQGGVARNRILEYVQSKFSSSKSAHEISQAIVRTYERFGIGTANRSSLNVSLREGSRESFAYVLHLEFPEPGMYSFEKIFDGPMHKWLLWDRQWMVRQLYRPAGSRTCCPRSARSTGCGSSRPSTASPTPMQRIVALAKESPP